MAERPFVDGPLSSPDEAAAAARAAAATWGLGDLVLIRMGMNGIFSAGDVVLRVSRPSAPPTASIELARVIADAGVRVAAPLRADAFHHGTLAVTAWERVVAVDREPDWRDVGRMVAVVHGLGRDDVPRDYPLPRCEHFPWWNLGELLTEVGDVVDDVARAGLAAIIARHRGWYEEVERVVCHGDVHPGNVVMTADGPALLDWDLLCLGPPGWDHASLLRAERWGWPASWYDDFAAGYGRSLADDPVTDAIAELRLVAATLMRLRAGRADPAAMPEAQRRLAYWRGEPDAPAWVAV